MRRGVKRRWGVGALIFTALTGLFNLHKYVQVISLGGFFTARDFEGRQVISWIGVPALQAMIDRYWEGNMFCEEIQALRQQHNDSHVPITVNMVFSCEELFSTSWIGSGNFISALYHMRMSALALGNVDMHMTCKDAAQVKSRLILPWFMGHYMGREQQQQQLPSPAWSVNQSCGPYATSPIAHMYQHMQYVLRRMAIGLVGLPVNDPSHPAHQWAQKYLWSIDTNVSNIPDLDLQLPVPQKDDAPLFPAESLELDDATIHFRCGGELVSCFCRLTADSLHDLALTRTRILRCSLPLCMLQIS